MPSLPTGTVTFLFTDIEGSTTLLQRLGDRRGMRAIRSLVRERNVRNRPSRNVSAYARQTMKDVIYGKWRYYDPADTIRFYALRLHEAGMIKSSPQKVIAEGTDWRFLTELKKELKPRR